MAYLISDEDFFSRLFSVILCWRFIRFFVVPLLLVSACNENEILEIQDGQGPT
jgi:hypothetical protein